MPASHSLLSRRHSSFFRRPAAQVFALLACLFLLGASAHAALLYVLTSDGKLRTGQTDAPNVLSPAVTITGLNAGDTLVAIDVRPQTQELYGLGANGAAGTIQLYHISPQNGVAVPVGVAGNFVDAAGNFVAAGGVGTKWDIDFNPSVDRLRVVNSLGQNFRMNPNTGACVDGELGGATGSVAGLNMDGSVNSGTTTVQGAAYTNNQPNNGGITTLYTLDATSDSLFIQNPPNAGTQSGGQTLQLGGNPLDISSVVGFDIAPGVNVTSSNSPVTTGSGFFVATVGGATGLYSVNLANGAATFIANVGDGTLPVVSAAFRTDLNVAIALAASGTQLIRFSPDTPGTTTTVTINGVTAGETLVGIDLRPQTGQIYGLGINSTAKTGTLYLIDPQATATTANCTVVGTAGQIAFVDAAGNAVAFDDPAIGGYGFDFNPNADRIRVVASSGLNFRINPITGAPIDGNLASTLGPVIGVNPDGAQSADSGSSAAAYTNNIANATATTLYTIDAVTNTLYIQTPPNAGTQINPLPILLPDATALDLSALGGFDIPNAVSVTVSNEPASGEGWFAGTVGGVTGLYRINLGGGFATPVGAIGAGTTPVAGLIVSIAPPTLVAERPAGTPIRLGQGNIDFGSAPVGSSVRVSVQLRNTGTQPLLYSAAFDSGAGLAIEAGANGSVKAGASTSVDLVFTPTISGVVSDVLRITSNDPAIPSFTIGIGATGFLAQEIDVEAPVGTVVQAGTGTVNFGSSPVGVAVTRDIKISNSGEVDLTYSTAFAKGANFTVTTNASGTIARGSSTTVTISYTPTEGIAASDRLNITSNDTDEALFGIELKGNGLAILGNDSAFSTPAAVTRFQPLANDPISGTLTITAVSNNQIQIQGRTLLIPAGFTGTFIYTVTDGTVTGTASVTVAAGTPTLAPIAYNGVILDGTGKVVGSSVVNLSAKGIGTAKVLTGAGSAVAKLKFAEGTNSLTVPSKLGSLTVDRQLNGSDGAVGVSLALTGGQTLTGVLHANVKIATAAKYTIELLSIDPATFPGGGYATATITKRGAVAIKGLLPDGNPFSAGTTLADNSTVSFFAITKSGVKPFGLVGGELALASLTDTDLTGELVWSKPTQVKGGKGTHLGGVDTSLTARGSLFDKLQPVLAGGALLKLFGGNLNADENTGVTVTAGIPTLPTGSLVTWKGPAKTGKSSTGLFSVTVTVPGATRPAKGSGVYLQKSDRAWGYFPGLTVGGRIELAIP